MSKDQGAPSRTNQALKPEPLSSLFFYNRKRTIGEIEGKTKLFILGSKLSLWPRSRTLENDEHMWLGMLETHQLPSLTTLRVQKFLQLNGRIDLLLLSRSLLGLFRGVIETGKLLFEVGLTENSSGWSRSTRT